MRCPFCGHLEDHVVDSRQSREGTSIRRRRECLGCERRFTSYERIEEVYPQIVKRDGSREEYRREKVLQGLRLAVRKRPVASERLEAVVDQLEEAMLELNTRELASSWIGEFVANALRTLDPVAYIRFASVYRAFSDIQQFLEELRELDRNTPAHPAAKGDAPPKGEEPRK